MDLGRHPFGRVYSPPGFGVFCKIVHSNLVDGEAIGRVLHVNVFASGVESETVFRCVPTSECGFSFGYCTTESRNRS